jgi:hypothetical protein
LVAGIGGCVLGSRDSTSTVIDKFIRDAKKVEVKEKDVLNPWEQ